MEIKHMSFPKRFWGHLTTITKHKFTVQALCFKLGLYKQGIQHDLSKYSPVEFWAGVKYFQGDRSPIDIEKRVEGYSLGWLHHKGRNKHHWEYWMDRKGKEPLIIFYNPPKNYIKEMVCDRVGACKIYQKENYTDASPYDYFMRTTDRQVMNPETAKQLEIYLGWIKEYGLEKAFQMIKED